MKREKILLSDLLEYELEVTDSNGYDYAEGYVMNAWFKDGTELTEAELEQLDNDDHDSIQELLLEKAFEDAVGRAEDMADAARGH